MRIAICEDTPSDARSLNESLTRYLDVNKLAAEVDFFTGGEDFLSAFEPGKFQIIFMDIYMAKSGITGMDAAKEVNALDKDAAIIFTTTSDEYTLAGYGVAVFYILKPVEQKDMNQAMEKCRLQIERFAKTIEIVVNRMPIQIRLRDIYYIEIIIRNCVFSFAAGKKTTSAMNISDLMKKLGGSTFIQCHRSYVVNILHVRKMTKTEFIFKNGEKVPIGRKYRDAAQDAYRECFEKLIMGEVL
ncbi:MAG: LytTR family DNA-binding domain-containing protein [Defluviitaleaceae bacterium]|nr:LytTR family DNA-binding domain-containing protein [Defluviitaleaceae bacterium]